MSTTLDGFLHCPVCGCNSATPVVECSICGNRSPYDTGELGPWDEDAGGDDSDHDGDYR